MEGSSTATEHFYLAAFQRVRDETELQSLWNTAAAQGDTASLMHAFGDTLGIDLTEAAEWFETEDNPFDPQDKLSADLTYAQFSRRLGNFLLFKAHECFSSLSLEVYLQHHWQLELLGAVPDIPLSTSWINKLLRMHNAEIYLRFTKSPVTPATSKHLLRDILTVCEVSAPESAIKDYYAKADQLDDKPMTFVEFVNSVEQWADSHSELQSAFRNMLALTRLEYAELVVTDALKPVLTDLNKALAKVAAAAPAEPTKELAAVQLRGITEIFDFYAKAKWSVGPTPTFDQIGLNNASWDLSKFLKFFTDFGLLNSSKLLSKSQLTMIFKKCAANAISLSVQQFTDALDKVAGCYYSEEYDTLHNTCHADKPTIQKRELLYALLKFHKPNSYLKKVKGFGIAFSKGKSAARIEASDLSRQYEFKPAPKLKHQVEEWVAKNSQPKVQKMRYLPEQPPTLIKHSTPAPRRVERVASKSSFKYSDRSSNRTKPVKKATQSVAPVDALTAKPMSLRELSNMKYIGKPLDFLEQDEETDQYLKKLYNFTKKPQDLSYVLRMQDDKVNRGLRALNRHKYS